MMHFKYFLQELPMDTKKALKRIQEGKVKVDIEDSDIKRLGLEVDRSSNRLAYAMVIAALIVAGALTINVEMPTILNIPWLSFLSFLIAAILGLILFTSILSEREVKP